MQIEQVKLIQNQRQQIKQTELNQIQAKNKSEQKISFANHQLDTNQPQKNKQQSINEQIEKVKQKQVANQNYQQNISQHIQQKQQFTHKNNQKTETQIQIKVHEVFYPSQSQQLKSSIGASSQKNVNQKEDSLQVQFKQKDKNISNMNKKFQYTNKSKQINLDKINLDKNKPQDRALFMLYKICKANKEKQDKFRIRNKSNINESKIYQNSRMNSIGKIRKVLYQSLDASRHKLNNIFNGGEQQFRKQKVGRIVKINLSQDKYKYKNNSIQQNSNLIHSPRNLANIGRIVKFTKNNDEQLSFRQSSHFQKQLFQAKTPFYKKSFQFEQQSFKFLSHNLPPLPKQQKTLLTPKQIQKQEKQRQIQTLQKCQKINLRRQLKKFIVSIIIQICDQAVDRVQQKRSFFSYRFHRYNNHKKSPEKSNWYGGIKMGEHIMLKSQRMIQNKQGMYFNTLSLSRSRKSNSIINLKQQGKDEQTNKSNDESQNQDDSQNKSSKWQKKKEKNKKEKSSDSQNQQNSSDNQQNSKQSQSSSSSSSSQKNDQSSDKQSSSREKDSQQSSSSDSQGQQETQKQNKSENNQKQSKSDSSHESSEQSKSSQQQKDEESNENLQKSQILQKSTSKPKIKINLSQQRQQANKNHKQLQNKIKIQKNQKQPKNIQTKNTNTNNRRKLK